MVNDLARYVDSYRKIVNDPASSVLLDVLAESVFEETDQKKENDLNYELPEFNPIVLESQPKDISKKRKTSSKPSKPSNQFMAFVIPISQILVKIKDNI